MYLKSIVEKKTMPKIYFSKKLKLKSQMIRLQLPTQHSAASICWWKLHWGCRNVLIPDGSATLLSYEYNHELEEM